jgi:hypothetical protein
VKRYIRLTITLVSEDDTPAHTGVFRMIFDHLDAAMEQNQSSGTFTQVFDDPEIDHPDIAGEFFVSHGVVDDDGR